MKYTFMRKAQIVLLMTFSLLTFPGCRLHVQPSVPVQPSSAAASSELSLDTLIFGDIPEGSVRYSAFPAVAGENCRLQVTDVLITPDTFYALIQLELPDNTGKTPLDPVFSLRYFAPSNNCGGIPYKLETIEEHKVYLLSTEHSTPIDQLELGLTAIPSFYGLKPLSEPLTVVLGKEFTSENSQRPHSSVNASSFWKERFGEGFEHIAEAVTHGAVSATNNRLRLTIESIVSDTHNTFILYSASSLDTTAQSDIRNSVLCEVSRDWTNPVLTIMTETVDMGTDQLLYGLIRIRSGSPIDAVRLRMEDLTVTAEITSLSNITGSKGNIKACISPLGIWLELAENRSGFPTHNIGLTYQDGTSITISAEQFAAQQEDSSPLRNIGWGSANQMAGNGCSYVSIPFLHPADLTQITTISVDKTEIPLR